MYEFQIEIGSSKLKICELKNKVQVTKIKVQVESKSTRRKS